MDEYNRHLIQVSYEAAARRMPKGKVPELAAVRAEMELRWIGDRDGLLDFWTHQTLERVPEERLARLTLKVWEYAVGLGFQWEQPADEAPEWTANALAILRWHWREYRCRVPIPTFSDDDIQQWLDHHAYPVHETDEQLSLFAYAQREGAWPGG